MAATDTNENALVKKDGALAGAAVSAAVGLAVYGIRKALAERGGGPSLDARDEGGGGGEHAGNSRARGDSMLVAAWESASHVLLPLAEDAADAAGKWAGKNAPAVVRDRLLPRFVESFKSAA